jgi:hypothetical protein
MAVSVLVQLELVTRSCEPITSLAHKPAWKLQRAHADRLQRIPHVALWWLAKVVNGGEIQIGMQRFQSWEQGSTQSRVVERNPLPAGEPPMVQPTDDDSSIYEIDHSPGSESGH